MPAQAQKLIDSKEIPLNDFVRPPYPIEIFSVNLSPDGGLRYQTVMPIAGRMAATTDAAKLRGALANPAGIYVFSGVVNDAGSVQPGQRTVFSPPDARIKVAPDTPVDWAVWGTISTDGPLRLPFGGNYNELSRLIGTTESKTTTLASLMSTGPGLNYDNYAAFPRYATVTSIVNPASGRVSSRTEQEDLQREANQAKLTRYIALAGDSPGQTGRVITVSANRFEAIATRFVKDDKNASARQFNLLTFDDTGTLLKDQPVQFTYNRALTMRIPVVNETGKVVGTLSVFGSGPGKKDAQDPEENRFSMVVTDEQGGIWSQFDWMANGSSNRAVMPTYALRRGDQLLMYSSNQQKLLKPVEESWSFDRAGKATLSGTLTYGDLAGRSKEVGTVSPENRQEKFNYSMAHYVDSFTDANGEVWVLLQRHANTPVAGSQEVAAPATTPAVASRLMGFANKLNQMTGQSAPAPAPVSTVVQAAPNRPNDVFVLHFDKNLILKQQTVVALQTGNLRIKRIELPASATYLLNDNANTLLSIRGGGLTVQRLTPADAMIAMPSETDNFVVDKAGQKLYAIYKLTKKPSQGKLLIYDLR